MNNVLLNFIVVATLLLRLSPVNAQDCGVERWRIKTLSDADTTEINFNKIKNTTVNEQVNLEAPFGRLYNRIKSETVLYTMDCYLIGYKKESDKDIHLIVQDINTEETMVIEIPSPECESIKSTSRYMQFIELSNWFENSMANFHKSFTLLPERKLISITGVGFWDYLHGQKGMAKNGREIHPVLTMVLCD